jgi:acyl dehydratase
MFEKKYFENFELDAVRKTIFSTIKESDIILHEGQTGDFFPHHMDAEWCKSQPFKKRIAHGTLVFSIAIGISANTINEVAMTYGYERLRFIKPVFIGDTLKVKITIQEKNEYKKPGFGLITELVEAFNQRQELVMICRHILLVEKSNQENK